MTRFLAAFLLLGASAMYAQGVPASLLGRWRVDRVVSVAPAACWNEEKAKALLGTPLVYLPRTLGWQGGEVPLEGLLAVSRSLDRKSFLQEYGVTLESLGIHAPSVTEVSLQHEDADVTGGSTEVPGDTVLLLASGRIVVSTCGVYFQAVRVRR